MRSSNQYAHLDAGIVGAVVTQGRTLGLVVVAEGVQGEPQRAELAALRVRYGQRFPFSPAVPADEFTSVLGSG